MTTDYAIKRYSLIVARVNKGIYPSINDLLHHLKVNDVGVSKRTLQRDIEKIRYTLGLEIKYDTVKNGYYMSESNYDLVDKFLELVELSKATELLLENFKALQSQSPYLHLGTGTRMKGIEQISPILKAIQNRRLIEFRHYNYHETAYKDVRLRPVLIKEYLQRWYVHGYSIEKDAYRTYGIDRISELNILDESFESPDVDEAVQKFNDHIGVNMTDGSLEDILLEFTPLQAEYALSLPWHPSQKLVERKEESVLISLRVRINYELTRLILNASPEVKVLKPAHLAASIKEVLSKSLNQY